MKIDPHLFSLLVSLVRVFSQLRFFVTFWFETFDLFNVYHYHYLPGNHGFCLYFDQNEFCCSPNMTKQVEAGVLLDTALQSMINALNLPLIVFDCNNSGHFIPTHLFFMVGWLPCYLLFDFFAK